MRNAPRSCGVERLLDDESLARKYLTLGLKFLAGQINWTKNKPFWDQKQIRGGRMIILRQWEYKVSMLKLTFLTLHPLRVGYETRNQGEMISKSKSWPGSHFSHNLRSLYEYLVACQSEDSLSHEMIKVYPLNCVECHV